MDRVTLNITDPSVIKWPRRCPACGEGVPADDAGLPRGERRVSSGKIDVDGVRQAMLLKDTEVLPAIWTRNDRSAWRPEAFDVIESISRGKGPTTACSG